MYCPRCRERIVENWSFCPRCGARLPAGEEAPRGPYQTTFNEMFREIEKQIKEALGPDATRNIEFFDLKPEFVRKDPRFRSGGFRIKVTRNGEGPPSIDIKAFGDIDEELAEKMTQALQARSQARQEETGEQEKEEEDAEIPGEARKVSDYTEPVAETRWAGDHLEVALALPDVKSEEDIVIRKVGESLEVRAFAGDRGYFKILAIPKDTKLISKSFKGDTLTMSIG